MALPAEPDTLRDALRRTYIHGMDEARARAILGEVRPEALVALLGEPAFPRPDNLVAVLAWTGGAEVVAPLVAWLRAQPLPPQSPEHGRALLLVPDALGRMAARGVPGALEALLAITEEAGSPARGTMAPERAAWEKRLLEEALWGLALSGSPLARGRLEELAAEGADLEEAARRQLRRWESLRPDPVPPGSAGELLRRGPTEPSNLAGDLDMHPSGRVHEAPLAYANHVDLALGDRMTDNRLDTVLREASLRAGRDDYDTDVACCIAVSRAGAGGNFGTPGDGLDIVDDQADLTAVFAAPGGRVKIVKLIKWCGSFNPNIIGCAETPGDDIALVRLSDPGTEAILWLHEYGHNADVLHSSDPRDIMHELNDGQNRGLSQNECNGFHAPHPSAGIALFDAGACTDSDADAVQDVADNCPGVANFDQLDTDGDGIGDLCESADTDGDGIPNDADNCQAVPNPDQADLDADGQGDACDADDDGDAVLDPTDNCPRVPNPTQADRDRDGTGDGCDACSDRDRDGYGAFGGAGCPGTGVDCNDDLAAAHPGAAEICDGMDNDCDLEADEARCEEFDANGDARVDGAELAWLGRAFGECRAEPPLPWWAPVDYTGDGCVDGDDLAVLAAAWGCVGPGPLCPP